MADDEKNKDFLFDNDPGNLIDKDDIDFTFSDIPVLGADKEKKDTFSFDQLPQGDDASIASLDAMLKDSLTGEYDDETRTTMEIEHVQEERKAKKKKQLVIKLSIGAGALVFLCIIVAGVMFFLARAKAREEEEAKKLTPAQQAALRVKQQQEKISRMVDSADALYKSGNTSKAEEKYAGVLKIDANNADALTGSGKCCESLGKTGEAEKYYTEAIQKKGADERPFSALAAIMIRRKEYKPAIKVLEKAMDKFPGEKVVLIPLADTYRTIEDDEKALKTYKKIPKSALQSSSLKSYAKLLSHESKEDAKKLYIYTAGKFKDFDSYVLASELSDDAKDKVQILTDAVVAMKDAGHSEDDAKFLFSRVLVEAGDKGKAASTLKEIKIEKLNPEFCTQLFALAKDAGMTDLKLFCSTILKARPDDFELQRTLQNQLFLSEGPLIVLDFYSDWWSANSDKPIANFLYAKAFGHSSSAIKYYRKALALDPEFFHASMELGKIYMDEKNWKEAEKAFAHCAKILKDDKKAWYLFALVRVKNGKGRAAIEEYGEFLDRQGMTRSRQAAELISLAMLLPTSDLAEKYLSILKEDSAFIKEYKLNKAKMHLLFDGDSVDAFTGTKTGKFREFCILKMLAAGKEREVLMMPTPAKEFPEFWKVFIARRKHFKNWKKSAEILYKKNKNAADPTTRIIVGLWLGKISLADFEKMINRVPFNKEALFYMILAEEYKRNKQFPNASIRYRKAKNVGRNIYSGIINHYSKRR